MRISNTIAIVLYLVSSSGCARADEKQPKEIDPFTPFAAANFGRFETLKSLIKDKPELLRATERRSGGTLLHYAARGNQPEIIRYLVKRGADVNARDDINETPLHSAAKFGGTFEAAEVLIELGADLNSRPEFPSIPRTRLDGTKVSKEYRNSVLEYAARSGDYRLVELLLKKGAKVQAEPLNILGNALHFACMGYFDSKYNEDPKTAGNRKVIAILSKYIDINCENEVKMRPLHYAAANGAVETVKYLVSNYDKIDLNAVEFSGGNTPLHLAVDPEPDFLGGPAKNRAMVIKILIEAGADVDRVNSKRLTPRQLAEKLGNKTILKAFETASPRRADNKPPSDSPNWSAEHQWTLRHDEGVYALAFSPDGKQLLTADGGGTVRLWDPSTGRELERFKDEKAWPLVRDIAWSPDGRYALLAAGQYKGNESLTFWDVKKWKAVRRFEGHWYAVTGAAFSPDGRRAVSGTIEGDIFAWDVQTGKQISHYKPELGLWNGKPDGDTHSLNVSPNGNICFWAGGNDNYQLRLFDISTGRELKRLETKERYGSPGVVDAVFTRDGSRVLAANSQGFLRIWDIEQGTSSPDLNISPEAPEVIESVAFSRNDRLALVGSGSELALWQIEDAGKGTPSVRRLLRIQHLHAGIEISSAFGRATAGIQRVALSPDNHYAAAADRGMVRIWKIRKKESTGE